MPLPVERRPDLLAVGITSDDIQRRRRQGELVSIRAGRYADAGAFAALGPLEQYRLRCLAAAADLPDDAVLSHESAACLLGLPLWPAEPGTVRVTRPGHGGGHRRPSVHTRFAALPDGDVIVRGGVRLTGPARTLVDLGRVRSFESAVVSADAARHRGLVSAAELAAALDRAARTPRVGRARQAMAFADGRSESVGESRSRVAIARAGLPAPDLQVELYSAADGRFLGRSDFGWREQRTVGEFDGRIKYGRLVPSGRQPGAVVFQEKRREDLIRGEGITVVRWTWAELDDGTAADRIRRALHLV
jgi:hypothetical protein